MDNYTPMVKVYVLLIRMGRRTIASVPDVIRPQVEEALKPNTIRSQAEEVLKQE